MGHEPINTSQARVRYEGPDDVTAIRRVVEAAFDSPVEAKIVEALRAAGFVTLSMVAVIGAEEIDSSPAEATEADLSPLGGEGGGWGGPDGRQNEGHGVGPSRVVGGEVIGHVLVTPVTLTTERGEERLLGLGPVAVLPEHQGRGVATLLVETCLELLRDSDVAGVVVTGDPDYFGRFGFIAASRWGLRADVVPPGEVLMALELSVGRLAGKSGVVRYRPEFSVPKDTSAAT